MSDFKTKEERFIATVWSTHALFCDCGNPVSHLPWSSRGEGDGSGGADGSREDGDGGDGLDLLLAAAAQAVEG